MTHIKNGDKLFLITRDDLTPGYQAVQSCHAIRQFVADHPEIDKEWFVNSNYLALLSVKDEIELMRLIVKARDMHIKYSLFREPDLNGEITSIAIEPGHKSIDLCKGLPLALKTIS